jgi:hypothetical protein
VNATHSKIPKLGFERSGWIASVGTPARSARRALAEEEDPDEDVCSFFRRGFGNENDELHWGRRAHAAAATVLHACAVHAQLWELYYLMQPLLAHAVAASALCRMAPNGAARLRRAAGTACTLA